MTKFTFKKREEKKLKTEKYGIATYQEISEIIGVNKQRLMRVKSKLGNIDAAIDYFESKIHKDKPKVLYLGDEYTITEASILLQVGYATIFNWRKSSFDITMAYERYLECKLSRTPSCGTVSIESRTKQSISSVIEKKNAGYATSYGRVNSK